MDLDNLIKSRFVEMFDGGKLWKKKKLGEVCELKAGKFISASDIHQRDAENVYPCYGGNGLRGYVAKYSHEGEYSLIGRQGALCGNVQLVQGRFYATEHAVVVDPNIKMNKRWLSYMLVEKNLNQFATGAAQPGLTVGRLNAIEVILPPLSLQNQFANFVQQVDKSKLSQNLQR